MLKTGNVKGDNMKTYEIVVPIDVAFSVYIKAKNADEAERLAERMYEDGTLHEEAAEYLRSDNCSFMLASYDVEEVLGE